MAVVTKELLFGAGVDCNALIKDALSPAYFPKEITLENCVDFSLNVGGVPLKPCFDAGKTKTVTVNSIDEMQRLASDCHAVGEINAKPELVKVSFSVEDVVIDDGTNPPIDPPITTGKQKHQPRLNPQASSLCPHLHDN